MKFRLLLFAALLLFGTALFAKNEINKPAFFSPWKITADTTVTLSVTVCDEDLPYDFNGQALSTPGTYHDTLQSSTGFDSIIVLHFLISCCKSSIPPNVSDICALAPLFCDDYLETTDFDLYQSTGEAPGNLASEFCYPIAQSRWLRFSTDCTDTTKMEVTVQNCVGSDPANGGIELAVFTTGDCLNFSKVGDCFAILNNTTQTVSFPTSPASGTYYLMIDGISDHECAFSFNMVSGVNTAIPSSTTTVGTATDGMISGDKDVCPGQTVTYTLTPPGCALTIPQFNCPLPAGGCQFCGSVPVLDSIRYKWHIPHCARFVGDSFGLEVEVVYDQCFFTTDTVIIEPIYIEIIPYYGDTIFVAGDTLTWCNCPGSTQQCGIIPPCDVTISFHIVHIDLVIPCVGPPPVFMGMSYPSPGQFFKFDPAGCIVFVIDVTMEQGPQLNVNTIFALITCVQPAMFTATSSPGASISWTPMFFGSPSNGPTYITFDGGPIQVTAMAANGCSTTQTVSAQYDINPPVAYLGADVTICASDVATLYSINAPYYTYHWSTGANSAIIQVSPPPNSSQTYSVTVTNAINGCTATDQIKVTTLKPILVTLPPSTICQGESITVGYETFTPASSTMLQVVLTSYQGCDSTVVKPVTVKPVVVTDMGVVGTLNCIQNSVSYLGNTYTQPGTYQVQTAACTFTKFTILSNANIPPAALGQAPTLTCVNTITYIPVLSPCSANQTCILLLPNGQQQIITSNTAPVTEPGSYQLLVTDLTNGCTNSATTTVNQDVVQPTVDIVPVNSVCAGQPVTLVAATTVQQMQWSTGDTGNNVVISPTANTTYSVTVVNSNGCTATASTSVQVTQPVNLLAGVVGKIDCNTPSVTYLGTTYTQGGTFTSNTGLCETTTFTIVEDLTPASTAQLGQPGTITCLTPTIEIPIVTTWAPNIACTIVGPGFNQQVTTSSVSVTAPGAYTFVVTNINSGCTSIAQVFVDQDVTPPFVNVSGATTTCAGDPVILTANTGSPQDQLLWNNGTTFNVNTVTPAQTTTYSVTATGANGCTETATATVNVNAVVQIDAGVVGTLNCTTASVTAYGQTYTQPGSYTIATGNCEQTTFTIDQNINPAPAAQLGQVSIINCAQPVVDIPILTPVTGNLIYTLAGPGGVQNITSNVVPVNQSGLYTLQITDPASGCTSETQVNVTEDFNPPTLTLSGAGTFCEGESITLTAVSNGILLWSDGATTSTTTVNPSQTSSYTVTASAANGCTQSETVTVTVNPQLIIDAGVAGTLDCNTISVSAFGQTYTQPGAYQVVTGPCETTTFTIDQNITPPLVSLGQAPAITCANLSVQVPVTSPMLPGITYELTGPDGSVQQITQPFFTATVPGIYTLQATDQIAGCSSSAQALVAADLNLPTLFTITDASICAGESITLSATSNGTLLWSNGSAASNITVSPASTTSFTVTATGANGCVNSQTVSVDVSPHTVLNTGIIGTLTCSVQNISYAGKSYQSPGTYTLPGICQDTLFQILQNISVPTAILNSPGVMPCNSSLVQLDLAGSNFGAGYNVQLVSPAGIITPTSLQIEVGATGTYTLVITDTSNGCTATDTETINAALEQVVEMGNAGTINCKTPEVTVMGQSFSQPGSYQISQDCITHLFEIDADTTAPQIGNIHTICDPALNGYQVAFDLLQSGGVLVNQQPVSGLQFQSAFMTDQDNYLFSVENLSNGCAVLVNGSNDCPEPVARIYVPNVILIDANDEDAWFTLFTGSEVPLEIELMQIYDRWGNKMFERANFAPNVPDLGWDGRRNGKAGLPGVYIYYVTIKFPDGSTKKMSGDVTVIR